MHLSFVSTTLGRAGNHRGFSPPGQDIDNLFLLVSGEFDRGNGQKFKSPGVCMYACMCLVINQTHTCKNI